MMRHIEQIRAAEIELVRPYFQPGTRVLEIGGGTGLQAALIASFGCEIESIDVKERDGKQNFAVRLYDGVHVPFEDGSFDLVFSSNVLEHVVNLSELFAEMRRVMKPDAVAIHLMPGTAWRFWTSIADYLHLLLRIIGVRRTESCGEEMPRFDEYVQQNSITSIVRRVLLGVPHGSHASALGELVQFSRRSWLRTFKKNGFDVTSVFGNGIFYSGHGIFRSLPLERRRQLARLLGSGCNVFVARRT